MSRVFRFVFLAVLALTASSVWAQSTGTIRGTVRDSSGAVVPAAEVTARQAATNLERKARTDQTGVFQLVALPVGVYRIEVTATGFRTSVREQLRVEVDEIAEINFALQVGEIAQTVTVDSAAQVVETNTMTVGDVINEFTVQNIPLNGRRFVDLALLTPGAVTPPQNGFLTAPLRGQGSFGVVTAGNREDTVNFMINGINLNDGVQNQITFQPSINTVSEFKMANSTFSAEYGHTSGTVVNIATRSGSNDFHGEVFDFVRNEGLDAKNFFDNPNLPIPPLKRNQFGVAAGGPVWIPGLYNGRDKTFWFFSYEGLRQRQAVTFNTLVPTEAQRAQVTNPVAQSLLPLIPLPNNPGGGANSFAGSGSAPVDINQWTFDLGHQLTQANRIHGYYAIQRDNRKEPATPVSNATIPGYGDIRAAQRQVFTLNDTHVFNSAVVNEFSFGFNRIFITFAPNFTEDATSFGFAPLSPFGPPAVTITAFNLTFGGVGNFPQGRGDTTAVWSDTISWLHGKHNFRFGTEIRRFYNNNFNNDMGTFTFTDFAAFQAGTPNRFTFNQGGTSSAIAQGGYQFFASDNYKVRSNLTLELGLRYEINTTPDERFDRFIAFDPATGATRRVGDAGFDQIYDTNHNIMPRIGLAWDPFGTGKTSVRAGYGIFFDQPVTNSVTGLSQNAPFTQNFVINNPASFANPIAGATPGTSNAVSSIAPDFRNSYAQNWNLNIQREIAANLVLSAGYYGAKGTHLRLSRNLNQPVAGVNPFTGFSTITEVNSLGNSSYNALWVTAKKRFSSGFQFNASYTYGKSIDYNSLNSQGVVLDDSTNPRANRGPSDFDVRHRFVISYLYDLPLHGSKGFLPAKLVEGWTLSGITSLQTGNPVTIVMTGTPSTSVTGFNNVVRPDVTGDPSGSLDPFGYFNPLAFARPATGVLRGNLGRNTLVYGPGFNNFDFSVTKRTPITERINLEFRTEFFNIFNHPNFGQPGRFCSPSTVAFNVSSISGTTFPVGTCLPNSSFGTITNAGTGATITPSSFGQITSTRFPAGDIGSARQIQFALKLKW